VRHALIEEAMGEKGGHCILPQYYVVKFETLKICIYFLMRFLHFPSILRLIGHIWYKEKNKQQRINQSLKHKFIKIMMYLLPYHFYFLLWYANKTESLKTHSENRAVKMGRNLSLSQFGQIWLFSWSG
jgi:putative copper export protein